ncbi:MAG: DNA polymerase III subunit beta [Desulfovibrio sp.]|nr:DNA polymerase III subunit beta [Desulfovibrio sp.]
MKLTVEKEKIIDGLIKAAAIMPAKAGAAYLRSIWLQAKGDTLSIMATDANIEFTGIYPAQVEEEGLAGIQGRAFVDLMRKLPNTPINISQDKDSSTLRLEQGRRNYRLAMSNPDWFQAFSPFPEGEAVAWTGSVLEEYLDRVTFCISDDDLQDSLGCLCIKPRENGRLDLCGLNGHQFALVSFIYDDLCSRLPPEGLLIQKKYLADIKKWLGPDELELNLTDKRLYLRRLDGAEMLSLPRALYDYPDYNLFMDKLNAPDLTRLSVGRKAVGECLGRLQVFNTEADRCVYMDMKPGEVLFSVQGSDLGSARENLEAEYDGSLERIAFPTKNLLDILGHFNSEQINMKFTGAEGPCGIVGPDDMGYVVIIMPMKMASSSYYDDEEESV